MQYVQSLIVLLLYLFIGLPFAILMLPTAPFIGASRRIAWTWLHFDMGLCSFIHGTERRTISGYLGERSPKLKRYKIMAKVVNGLARVFGDEPYHCERAYEWEIEEGVAERKYKPKE